MKKSSSRSFFQVFLLQPSVLKAGFFFLLAANSVIADPSLSDSVTDWPSRCLQWRIYRYTDHVNVESMPSSRSCAPRGLARHFSERDNPGSGDSVIRPGLNYASSVAGQVILSQSNYMTVTARTEPPPSSPPPLPPGRRAVPSLSRPPLSSAGSAGGRWVTLSRLSQGGTPRPDGGTWTGHTDATDGSAQFRRCRRYWLISIKNPPPPLLFFLKS